MIESDEAKFKLFDYRDGRGENDIKNWTAGQQKRQRGQLNSKLDMLQRYGDDVGNNVLMRMSANIYKLKAKTKQVQLRPMVCRGPIDDDAEFTILIGAIEVSWQLQPADAVQRAEERRLEIILDPEERRVPHERID